MRTFHRMALGGFVLSSIAIGIACSSDPSMSDAGDLPDTSAPLDSGTMDGSMMQDTGVADTFVPMDACMTTPCVTQLAAGYLYECALLSDNSVRCWGSNQQGQLGRVLIDGSTTAQPAPVSGLSNAVQIAAGFYHACALRADGHVLCWGTNTSGQLGPAGADASVVLAAVDITGIPGTVKSIHVGGYFTCAHLTDKRVFCWGDAAYGFLGGTKLDAGTWTPTSQPTPTEVTALGMPDEINAGDRYVCARTGGNVSCVGNNSFGQLGRGDAGLNLNANTAASVVGLANVTAAYESEAYHACVLAGGNVMCWGYNSNGQVGRSPEAGTAVQTPNTVSGLATVSEVSAGGSSTCARLQNGALKCWGDNTGGQLALSPEAGTIFPSPVDVSGVTNVVQIATGHVSTCALILGGSVVCWGLNTSNELGRTDSGVASWVPAPVVF